MGSVGALSPLRTYTSQGIDDFWSILNTLEVLSLLFLKLCAFDVHHHGIYFIIPMKKLLRSNCNPRWIKMVAFIMSHDGFTVVISNI